MGESEKYEVEITSSGKRYYFEVIENFYEKMSYETAGIKSEELYQSALSLEFFPQRGQTELVLAHLGKGHRSLLYHVTRRNTIKIIYFIDQARKKVFVSDFFPTRMDAKKIGVRQFPLG